MTVSKEDKKFMARALELAAQANHRCSPNPMVGALIVKSRKVVGEGFHLKAGKAHAEIEALRKAGKKAQGATLYVSLEPCCHYGKTPPCTEAVIKSGVARVVIAMRDPHPKVSGKGIRALKSAGINVETGVLQAEAKKLNERFITWVTKARPWITIKSAITLDGMIASFTQPSWITGKEARRQTHLLRAEHDAILIGSGTLKYDNPRLTCRLPQSDQPRQPVKVLVSTHLDFASDKRIFDSGRVIVMTSDQANPREVKSIERLGHEVVTIPVKRNRLNLESIFKALAEREISSVLIEGGAAIYSSLFEQGLMDWIHLFVAPTLLGSAKGKNIHILSDLTTAGVDDAFTIEERSVIDCGRDLWISGRPVRR